MTEPMEYARVTITVERGSRTATITVPKVMGFEIVPNYDEPDDIDVGEGVTLTVAQMTGLNFRMKPLVEDGVYFTGVTTESEPAS